MTDIDFIELMEKTIQSQYGNSKHIQGILKSFADKISPNEDIKLFFENIFDPRTARGVGLDIWGRIVGAERNIETYSDEFWGLRGQNLKNLNEAPFYHEGVTKIYHLEDEAFRELIFLKAYANISDATMPSIKAIINMLYPGGGTAIEAGHMKIRVIFLDYEMDPYSFALFKQYSLQCLGAGVGWEYYIIDPQETFGFDGSLMETFDQGIFNPYGIVQP